MLISRLRWLRDLHQANFDAKHTANCSLHDKLHQIWKPDLVYIPNMEGSHYYATALVLVNMRADRGWPGLPARI